MSGSGWAKLLTFVDHWLFTRIWRSDTMGVNNFKNVLSHSLSKKLVDHS